MTTAVDLLSNPSLGLVREVRSSQIQMTGSVEAAVANGGIYVCEAAVGVGKSWAYLTPALMAQGRRIIVSTAKKGLQDQLIQKDLPAVKAALTRVLGAKRVAEINADPTTKNPRNTGIALKGKGNYACRMLARGQDYDAAYWNWLDKVTKYGDRADYPGAPPMWWGSATAEDCIGRSCKLYNTCGYARLKGDVEQSQVTVINHHLLGSDMYFGHGKLTGGPFDVLIIDEAHALADGVRAAFTLKISENSVTDIGKTLTKTDFEFHKFPSLAAAWAALFRALPNTHYRDPHLRTIPVFPTGIHDVVLGLTDLSREVQGLLTRYGITGEPTDPEYWDRVGKALDAIKSDDERAQVASICTIRRRLGHLRKSVGVMQGENTEVADVFDEDAKALIAARNQRIQDNTVVYANADKHGRFHISAAPVELGGILHGYLSKIKTIIITSATLAVNGSFAHLNEVIGVKPTNEEILPTAFDYAAQGFVYIPKDIPHATRKDDNYQEVMDKRIDRCVELVKLSQGGAFVLTTANDELDQVADALIKRTPCPVFVQGHAKNPWHGDPQTILKEFLKTKNGVLVGSKSFWEGVDVAGEQLRLVVIMKCPFPVPTDPLIQARKRKYEGMTGWRKVDLVDMIISLRQGVGRLIRSRADRGVVAILDSRLWSKPYGVGARASLQFPITDDVGLCRTFLPRFVAHFRKVSQDAPIAV